MSITELFMLIEKQAEMEAKDEPVKTQFAAKYAYFSAKMFSALLEANLTDEQIVSIMSRLKLNEMVDINE